MSDDDDKIVEMFPGAIQEEATVSELLEKANEEGLEHAVVIGLTHEEEFVFLTNKFNIRNLFFMFERGRHIVNTLIDEYEIPRD